MAQNEPEYGAMKRAAAWMEAVSFSVARCPKMVVRKKHKIRNEHRTTENGQRERYSEQPEFAAQKENNLIFVPHKPGPE
jgi:hypothetical protein